MTMSDLHGTPLTEGMTAKLSGGYADSAVPVYLIHEEVEVVGFGRSRVVVKLLSRDYASRPLLRVLPRTLVVTLAEDTEVVCATCGRLSVRPLVTPATAQMWVDHHRRIEPEHLVEVTTHSDSRH